MGGPTSMSLNLPSGGQVADIGGLGASGSSTYVPRSACELQAAGVQLGEERASDRRRRSFAGMRRVYWISRD
jgi:hypothetical protein